jgi:hypothetical protein
VVAVSQWLLIVISLFLKKSEFWGFLGVFLGVSTMFIVTMNFARIEL